MMSSTDLETLDEDRRRSFDGECDVNDVGGGMDDDLAFDDLVAFMSQFPHLSLPLTSFP